jgi:hypothetical protein
MTILTSPKLTALTEDREALKAKAKQSRDEYWRLTKLLNPAHMDVTVSHIEFAKPLNYAVIGIEHSLPHSVVSTDPQGQEEAARKNDELQRTLAGQPLADSKSIREKLESTHRQWIAYEDAIEFRTREIDSERAALAVQYCKQLRPKYEDQMKRLCKTLIESHAALQELNALKRHLIDNQLGTRCGVCTDMPDFLPSPNDSEWGDFFRDAKRAGWIK